MLASARWGRAGVVGEPGGVGWVGEVDVGAVGVVRGRVFPVVSVRSDVRSSNNRSARHAPTVRLGRPRSAATNPNQLREVPPRREDCRLTKIRLVVESYIMRGMHPPCGARSLHPVMMSALSLRTMCQQSGPAPRLRVTFASMLFGQGVTSSALDDCSMRDAVRDALRGEQRHVRAARDVGVPSGESAA
jgi:hypothetical protein